MRFMAGGQLPLEPFVANKHLISTPPLRRAPQIKHARARQRGRRRHQRKADGRISGGTQQPGLLHSTPAVLFNRCSSHRRPRQSTVHPKARHFVPCKSKISGQETTIRSGGQVGIVRSQDYGGEDGTTGVGFRQRRPTVSAVHWMWGLIVPHPGSGNPSGRKPVGPACEQLCFSSTN